jgi:hypothetical protein
MNPNDRLAVQEQLSNLFGTYRAEWLRERIFEFFTEPRYFPELATARSCVLIGGRGTGKTTVLRGLSYEGQLSISHSSPHGAILQLPFFGLYHRINTNHVAAFSGQELSEQQWTAHFAHYFNLLLCDLVLDFAGRFEDISGTQLDVDSRACSRIASSLHLTSCTTHHDLRNSLIDARIAFEASVNNVADSPRARLSLQQAPVDLLCSALLAQPPLRTKYFCFLLDEYENLLEYQQRLVNTFIKHSSGLYYFKLGVKELGWRCHSTLNEHEQLIHPADYARVSISEHLQGDAFRTFAFDVCQARLSRLELPKHHVLRNVESALPGMSSEDESIALGVEEVIAPVVKHIAKSGNARHSDAVRRMHPLELFLLAGWAGAHETDVLQLLDEITSTPKAWKERYENYKVAALFAIRRGKRGIDKYYCGWETFTLMGAGNIRYVLELVDQSFLLHSQVADNLSQPPSPDLQTKAAQRVGSMNLAELEGLASNGARLTKLLLSLGRIFQEFAAEPFGHAAEIKQFCVSDHLPEAEELLRTAIMHLALLRYQGTKLGDQSDTQEYDYTIHPVFSALFEISPRRKRKMTMSSQKLLDCVAQPKKTIDALLKSHHRSGEIPLPQQLRLFNRFYDGE